ncbi:hypothetical protein U1Q18_041912 [Sarracenia purpurea var. burkii]
MESMCLKQNRTQTGFALSVAESATVVCAGKQKDGLPLVLFIRRAKARSVSTFQISQLGFKSVAHYLIQTQRSETDSDKTAHNNVPVSAKRSLPFSDTEATSEHKDSRMSNDDHHKPGNPKFADNKVEDDEFKGEKQEKTHIPEHNKHDCHKVLTEPESEDNKTDEDIKGNKEEKISQNSKRKSPDSIAGRLRQRRRTGKRAELEPQNDSIAA